MYKIIDAWVIEFKSGYLDDQMGLSLTCHHSEVAVGRIFLILMLIDTLKNLSFAWLGSLLIGIGIYMLGGILLNCGMSSSTPHLLGFGFRYGKIYRYPSFCHVVFEAMSHQHDTCHDLTNKFQNELLL